MKKLKIYLKKRWNKIEYKHIEIFYLLLALSTLISFIFAIFNKTINIWDIIAIILMVIWMIVCYLYYVFYDKVEAKKNESKK